MRKHKVIQLAIGIAVATGITATPAIAVAEEATGSTDLVITRVDKTTDDKDVDGTEEQIRWRVSVLDGTVLDDHVESGEYDHLAGMTDPTADEKGPVEAIGDFVAGVLDGIREFTASLGMSTGE